MVSCDGSVLYQILLSIDDSLRLSLSLSLSILICKSVNLIQDRLVVVVYLIYGRLDDQGAYVAQRPSILLITCCLVRLVHLDIGRNALRVMELGDLDRILPGSYKWLVVC